MQKDSDLVSISTMTNICPGRVRAVISLVLRHTDPLPLDILDMIRSHHRDPHFGKAADSTVGALCFWGVNGKVKGKVAVSLEVLQDVDDMMGLEV